MCTFCVDAVQHKRPSVPFLCLRAAAPQRERDERRRTQTVKGSEEDAEKYKINDEFYTMTDDEEYLCELLCQECDTAPEISEINGMCAL